MRKITKALGMIHGVPDALFLKIAYRIEMGERLHLRHPQGFNEKLQWLKCYGAMERFCPLADKWTARAHVAQVLGEQYLVPLLGVYDAPGQIPWDQLPGQFVVKCTHGSHANIIVTDKGKLNRCLAQQKLARWLKQSWFWIGREPVYRSQTPRIVVERYLGQGDRLPVDYKVMCFHGVPQVVQLHEKAGRAHTIGFFDVQGKKLPMNKAGYGVGTTRSLDQAAIAPLLDAAGKLAASVDTPYVRCDFYLLDGRVYFSELTFFDSSGFKRFEPQGVERWLGDMIHLNPMACPRCGATMSIRSIEGSLTCDCVERYDQCPACGQQRMVALEASS